MGSKDVFTHVPPAGFDRGFFSDILIERNTFVDPAGLLLELNLGRNVIFRDNAIVFTGRRAVRDYTGSFALGDVEDVFITGNRYRCALGAAVVPQVTAAAGAQNVVVRENAVAFDPVVTVVSPTFSASRCRRR